MMNSNHYSKYRLDLNSQDVNENEITHYQGSLQL